MSTITTLEQFRSKSHRVGPPPANWKTDWRMVWADSLATVAAVVLASTLVFEVLRIAINYAH